MRQLSMSATDNKSAAANLRAQLKGGPTDIPGTPQPSGQGEFSTSSQKTPDVPNGSGTPDSASRKRKRAGELREDSGIVLGREKGALLPPLPLPLLSPPDSDSESEPEDDVRLWEDGWKDRYYSNKFSVPAGDEEFVNSVVRAPVTVQWFDGILNYKCTCIFFVN